MESTPTPQVTACCLADVSDGQREGSCLQGPLALGPSSLSGALAPPNLLPFEVHPLFSLCTLAVTKQKGVNNTESHREKAEKEA